MSSSAVSHLPNAGLNIGQVLQLLSSEYSDLTPSKLRFLEDQGLIQPQRTKSGYRKFSQSDIDRLRQILTLQRDHYLPLKVIAEVLTEFDASAEVAGVSSVPLVEASTLLQSSVVLNRQELMRKTGATVELLSEATRAGLLPVTNVYSEDVIPEVHALVKLQTLGLSPRNLRLIRHACDREAQLIESANQARGLSRGSAEANKSAANIAELLSIVHAAVLCRTV